MESGAVSKNREHHTRQAGAKAKKKATNARKKQADLDLSKHRQTKAFNVHKIGRAKKAIQRNLDRGHKKDHVPLVSREGVTPPPSTVVVMGPPGVGKSSIIRSLVKRYTKQNLSEVKGPVTVLAGKNKRLTFIECPNDLNGMLDLAKVADLVILVIDASFGFEMETFEFLNMLQVHGFPKVMGVLTHLDKIRDGKRQQRIKKTLKSRFWVEVYQGAKLFYIPGLVNGGYPHRDVHNLSLFISRMKFRPLTWRSAHSHVVVDRVEDLTDPATLQADPTTDRRVALFGYVRGTHLKRGQKVHLCGVGDYYMASLGSLPDPAPLPETDPEKRKQRRSLKAKDTLVYAPMSDVGTVMMDENAVYINIPHAQFTRHGDLTKDGADADAEMADEADEEEGIRGDELHGGDGIRMVRRLQRPGAGLDDRLEQATLSLFKGSRGVRAEEVEDEEPAQAGAASGARALPAEERVWDEEAGRWRRRAVLDDDEDASEEEDDDEDDEGSSSSSNNSGSDSSSDDDDDEEEEEEEEEDEGAGGRKRRRRPSAVAGAGADYSATQPPTLPGAEESAGRWKSRLLAGAGARMAAREARGAEKDLMTLVYGDSAARLDVSLPDRAGPSARDRDADDVEDDDGDLFTLVRRSDAPAAAGDGAGPEEENIDEADVTVWRPPRAQRRLGQLLMALEEEEAEETDSDSDSDSDGAEEEDDDDDQEAASGSSGEEEEDSDSDSDSDSEDGEGGLAAALAEMKLSLKNRFVTGDWGKSGGAAAGGEDDDEPVYGDFEDLEEADGEDEDGDDEAAALRAAKEAKKKAFDSLYDGGKVRGDGDDEAAAGDGGGSAAGDEDDQAAAMQEVIKRGLDAVDFGDAGHKAVLDRIGEQAKVNAETFAAEGGEAKARFQGVGPGEYVRVLLDGVPAEFVTEFSPVRPVVLGALLPQEEGTSMLRVRIKRHRWHKRILKSNDPLVLSVGWRRFQTLPLYFMQDDNERMRFLKYTPEHLHCQAALMGPVTPPNTGVLAYQTARGQAREFRIAATGTCLEVDASFNVVKKLKLVGYPFKVFKKTALIKGMFNSKLEAARFIGAKLKTVSGLRGQIKKAVSTQGPTGTFRATFEDKILMSDIVFLRTWVPVHPKELYNPITNNLAPPVSGMRRAAPTRGKDEDQDGDLWDRPEADDDELATAAEEEEEEEGEDPSDGVVMMKTMRQLRRERGVAVQTSRDSLYTEVERSTRRFFPLRVPKSIEEALPYSAKPKHQALVAGSKAAAERRAQAKGAKAPKRLPYAARRAVIASKSERDRMRMEQLISTVSKVKAAKTKDRLKAQAKARAEKLARDPEMRSREEYRKAEKKRRFKELQQAKDRQAARQEGGRGRKGGGKRARRDE